MMERNSKLAIAGSLLWVALATGIILGTHGEASAAGNADGVRSDQATAEWLAFPASHNVGQTHDELFRQC